MICSICTSSDIQGLERWEAHLHPLEQGGSVSVWSVRHLQPGAHRLKLLQDHLDQADLIVLLLSADFFSDNECILLMERALARHQQSTVRIIPLLLRPVSWHETKLAALTPLPSDRRAITLWENTDAAFDDCVRNLLRILGSPITAPLVQKSQQALVDEQNRERLIQRVRNFWIKDVFEKSLHNAALMTLGLQESPEAVENPWRLVIQEAEHAGILLPASTSITEVYDEAHGELLILGEPGAGKTTLLLELAHDLLERAEQGRVHLLPVIFNLSSWQKRQPLEVWLLEELETKYQVPRMVGSDWITTDQILLLLDGLDEVDAASRPDCMEAINEYHRAHHLIPLVVCCRVDEYLLQEHRLALSRAVTIQPLTTEQVNEYLLRVGEQVASLKSAFQSDPVLQELATTPLMLTILILAYRGSSLEEMKGGASADVRRQQIFATYTQRMLKRRAAKSRYGPQQTIHWLSSLAWQMKQQSQTVFYIERMQPSWLLSKWQRRFYHGLIVGPIWGLFIEIGFPYLNGQPLLWLTIVITAFLIGWLFGWVSEPEAETKETKTIARCLGMCIQRRLAPVLESRVGFGILGGFLVGIGVAFYAYRLEYPNWLFRMADTLSNGLGYGIFTGLFLGLAIKLERSIEPVEGLNWSWRGVRKNIVRWLLIGMGTGLIVGMVSALPLKREVWLGYGFSFVLLAMLQFAFFVMLTSGVIPGLSKRTLDRQRLVTPNQGTWRSFRYGAIMAIITVVIFAIFIGANAFLALRLAPTEFIASIPAALPGFCPNAGQGCLTWVQEHGDLYVAALLEVLTGAATLGLTAGLYCGGRAYLQHFVLRFLLWQARSLPFDYPRFLDYAAERILLRKVGGGYIFIHRLLLEYFANLDSPVIPASSPQRRRHGAN